MVDKRDWRKVFKIYSAIAAIIITVIIIGVILPALSVNLFGKTNTADLKAIPSPTPVPTPMAQEDPTTSKEITDALWMWVGADYQALDSAHYYSNREVWIYLRPAIDYSYVNGRLVQSIDRQRTAKAMISATCYLLTPPCQYIQCSNGAKFGEPTESAFFSQIDYITITVITSKVDVHGNTQTQTIMQAKRSIVNADQVNWCNLRNYENPTQAVKANFDFTWGL
jgi:hypothetical protein